MAKNTKTGAVIAYAKVPVTYEGTVLSVSKAGVEITARPYGKQTYTDMFFPIADVIAHSDIGAGFVTVMESRQVASYYGEITTDNNISISTEGREIVFSSTDDVTIRVDYDYNDLPSTTDAKIAKRNTDKLHTFIGRQEEKSGGSKKAGGAKKKKKK